MSYNIKFNNVSVNYQTFSNIKLTIEVQNQANTTLYLNKEVLLYDGLLEDSIHVEGVSKINCRIMEENERFKHVIVLPANSSEQHSIYFGHLCDFRNAEAGVYKLIYTPSVQECTDESMQKCLPAYVLLGETEFYVGA